MSRFPSASAGANSLPTSTFAAFAARLRAAARDPDFVLLHLGDTYPLPPEPALAVDLRRPELHRYGPTPGLPALREAGARDLRELGLGWDALGERTFVTTGATGALDLAMSATLDPGDEVLVLTPTWPLVFGLVTRRGGVLVEVPVGSEAAPALLDSPEALIARVRAACGERTRALAFCNPNNPAGFVYSRAHLEALGELARELGLWVYYDAVYTDLCLEASARPLADLPEHLAERTFVALSYSKSFGLAGHRVGLLAAPPAVAGTIPKLQTHTTYHPSNLAQEMALACLRHEAVASRGVRQDLVREGARLTLATLGEHVVAPPAGGAFVYLDLRAFAADAQGVLDLIGRCLDRGVSLAPGIPFGRDFGRYARLCYTSAPPDRLLVGLERVRDVLASSA